MTYPWSAGDELAAADLNAALSWQLIGSAALSGASPEFTDLDNYSELLILLEEASTTGSSSRLVKVSSDNGSSYYEADGDYRNGGTTQTALLLSGGSTSIFHCLAQIRLFNKAGVKKPAFTPVSSNTQQIINRTEAMNAIQISSSGSDFTGGTVYVYGRP